MSWEAWFTLSLTALTFWALVKDWATPDVLFVLTAAVLSALGIITPTEAFAGFSNTGMLTVAALFVV